MSALAEDYASLPDAVLASRIAAHDTRAVRIVVERCNRRLFRTAWSILKDRAEAEDIVQSAYLRGFAAIGTFAGRASLATWLTRITINEALQRRRALERRRAQLAAASVADLGAYRSRIMPGSAQPCTPDAELGRAQIRTMLEQAIADLPEKFRMVFLLCEVEGLSVEEAAAILEIPRTTVKTRNFRARRRLRVMLAPELHSALTGTFPFGGSHCAAMTARVLAKWCGRAPQAPETGLRSRA